MITVLKRWLDKYLGNEHVLLLFGLGIGLYLFFNLLGGLLSPFILSFVLAFLLQSVVVRLQSYNIHRTVSACIALLLLIGVIFLLLFYLLPTIWSQLTSLIGNWSGKISKTQQLIIDLSQRYPDYVTDANIQQVVGYLQAELPQIGERLIAYIIAQLPGVFMLSVYIVLVPVLTFFIMGEWERLSHYVTHWINSKGGMLKSVYSEMDVQIANYIRGKAIEIVIIAVVSYVVFGAFGLQYALLLAFAVGFSVLVPYVGAFIVTAPVAFVAILQWGWSLDTLYLLLAYLIIQILDGNLLVPLLFSDAVNLSPLVIILAVIIFGGLWGFWGVFFAIPLASLFNAVVKSFPKASQQE